MAFIRSGIGYLGSTVGKGGKAILWAATVGYAGERPFCSNKKLEDTADSSQPGDTVAVQSIQNLSKELTRVNQEKTLAEREFHESLLTLANECPNIQTGIDNLHSYLRKKREATERTSSTITDQRAKLINIESEVQGLETQLSTKSDSTDGDKDSKPLQTQLANKRNQLKETQDKIRNLEDQSGKESAVVTEISEKLSTLTRQLESTRALLDPKSAENDKTSRTLDALKTEVENINKAAQTKLAENPQIISGLTHLAQEVEEIKGTVNTKLTEEPQKNGISKKANVAWGTALVGTTALGLGVDYHESKQNQAQAQQITSLQNQLQAGAGPPPPTQSFVG